MVDEERNQLKVSILERLRSVIDPETGVDVVRMHLIEHLEADPNGKVLYRFRPSSPFCPIAIPLALEVQRVVAGTPGVTDQEMEVVGWIGAKELTAWLSEAPSGGAKQA
jgi:metal-sulfur cluster biosynthetic enzyme